MIYRISLLLLFLAFISCEKQLDPPDTIAQQIKKVIEHRKVTRVIPAASYSEYFNFAYDPGNTYGDLFSIEKDFISLGAVSWNLNLLKSYRIDVINSTVVMGLFF
ncbi:MAG: hypothetical protein KA143_14370 [Saprospiraceae bacterium]|nr:hypothetical protein [Saprospiraceae bacterium]